MNISVFTSHAYDKECNVKFQTLNASCFDFWHTPNTEIQLADNLFKIDTGLNLLNTDHLPYGALQIISRSGLTHKNICCVANSPGIIDYDYKDRIYILLRVYDLPHFKELLKRKFRVAQGMFVTAHKPSCIPVIGKTREGGFGSTDK